MWNVIILFHVLVPFVLTLDRNIWLVCVPHLLRLLAYAEFIETCDDRPASSLTQEQQRSSRPWLLHVLSAGSMACWWSEWNEAKLSVRYFEALLHWEWALDVAVCACTGRRRDVQLLTSVMSLKCCCAYCSTTTSLLNSTSLTRHAYVCLGLSLFDMTSFRLSLAILSVIWHYVY